MTVWSAAANFDVLGPYFFEEEEDKAVSVTSARPVLMLQNFLKPKLQEILGVNATVWFQ